MVRLKDTVENHSSIVIKLFQFLYGTIKSMMRKCLMSSLYIFQFLYGTIKRIKNKKFHIGRRLFQFLYGTIKSRYFLQ